ncbi:MAG: D-alanyl-D-alanine carboxypeptidase [Acidimicrobiia bacterium]|nr:D-alanyl-D-alanine carboxypeptidase [Acidimicrobiia bacterium]
MALLLVLALAFPQAILRAPDPAPTLPAGISAEAWLIYDDSYDLEIASFRADRSAPMASTTKLMTALLVVENADLDDEVSISRRAQATGHKQIYARQGETWAVGELLEAVMVVSANDAAVALAEHVGGSVGEFVELMNERASELGLNDTSYANPHGLDAGGQYTSARDLLTLAREVMTHSTLASMALRQEALLVRGDGTAQRRESTNELLSWFPGAIGVKTGWTTGAGDVLVAAAERDGRRLYAVVMGSTDANADASRLLEYGFTVFGTAERRLVPLMEDRRLARALRATLSEDVVARLAHLRGLDKREEAPWE